MTWPWTADAVLWWLPTAGVAAMTVAAVAAVAAQPWRPVRKYWVAAVLLCGAAAIGASAWQQARGWTALAHEADRLRDIGSRLDQLGRLLPGGPGKTEAETFDTAAAAIRALNARISTLDSQIEMLRQKTRARSIDPDTAAQIAAYLRQSGSHRVVVSCAPDDVEAYAYANQVANVLREAGWDALGPEKTAIFGEAPGMEVRLYVRNAAGPPDAANLLIAAFTHFNIPFQSGVTPSEAIPDPATTELFVSHKP
jgi:hypothetical protein